MRTATVSCLMILLAGCHGAQNSAPPKKVVHGAKPAPEPTAAGQAFRLKEEPTNGKGVLSASPGFQRWRRSRHRRPDRRQHETVYGPRGVHDRG